MYIYVLLHFVFVYNFCFPLSPLLSITLAVKKWSALVFICDLSLRNLCPRQVVKIIYAGSLEQTETVIIKTYLLNLSNNRYFQAETVE